MGVYTGTSSASSASSGPSSSSSSSSSSSPSRAAKREKKERAARLEGAKAAAATLRKRRALKGRSMLSRLNPAAALRRMLWPPPIRGFVRSSPKYNNVEGDLARFLYAFTQRRKLPRAALRAVRARFLADGSSPDEQNPDREIANNCMHYAAMGGHLPLLELLLEYGAKLDPMNLLNETPLLLAIRRGHWGVALRLVERGANCNFADAEKRSPLFAACSLGTEAGALPVVRAMLLKGGADQTMWRARASPLEVATARGDTKMVAVLRPFLTRDRDVALREEQRRAMEALEAQKKKWAAKGAFAASRAPDEWGGMGAAERREAMGEQKRARKLAKDAELKKKAKKKARAEDAARKKQTVAKLKAAADAAQHSPDEHPAMQAEHMKVAVVGWRHLDAVELGQNMVAGGAITNRQAFGASFGPRSFAFDLTEAPKEAPPAHKGASGADLRLDHLDFGPADPLLDKAAEKSHPAAQGGKWGGKTAFPTGLLLGDSDDDESGLEASFASSSSTAGSPIKGAVPKMPQLQTSLDQQGWKTALHSMDYRTPRHGLFELPIQQASSHPLDASAIWSVSLDTSQIEDMVNLENRQATEVTSAHTLTAAQKRQHGA
jgi:hypothetical protein